MCQAADEGSSPRQFAQAAKRATALVELKGRGGSGSAFCIHPSGVFVTNVHVVQGEVSLVLDPGQKTEKAYPARIIRTDNEQDLALLRIDGVKDLSALTLGSDANLGELTDVWAFGYSSGPAPVFTANEGSIQALPPKGSRPPRIQLKAALDGGNAGGPLLDRRGNVIGVVVGVQGGGVAWAIPISSVTSFVSPPDVRFDPPFLRPAESEKPVCFEARVTPILPPAKPLTVELVLNAAKGSERKHRMEAHGDRYRVTAVPVPPERLPVLAQFDDGSLSATATDQAFEAAGHVLKLSTVRGIRFGAKPRVVKDDGERLDGPVAGLDAVQLRLGGQTLAVNLARAKQVTVTPVAEPDQVSCTLLVSQGGKEVLRQSRALSGLGPIKNPGFEAGLDGWGIFRNHPGAQFEFDTEVAREGWQALRVTVSEPIDTGCQQEIMLKPGQWYRFSGWVRTRGLDPHGAGAYGTFHIHARGTNDFIARGENHGGDTKWTQVSIPFQARPDGFTRIVAYFVGFGAGTGTAWFDDLKLAELRKPPAGK
jgi:hypothetical protein